MTILESAHSGTINKYFPDRGYGFIYDEQMQKTIFFHISNVKDNAEPERGDHCVFDVSQNDKGYTAVNIQIER